MCEALSPEINAGRWASLAGVPSLVWDLQLSQSREAELIYWVTECVWSAREDISKTKFNWDKCKVLALGSKSIVQTLGWSPGVCGLKLLLYGGSVKCLLKDVMRWPRTVETHT